MRGEPRADSSKCALRLIEIRSRGEVAQMLGISRQAVHQIERIALWKLRHRLAKALESAAGTHEDYNEIIKSML